MLSWGLGSLGVAILFNTQTVLLTRFMTDEMGIAASTAGFLLLVSKLYDAVTDPVMGYITDHTDSKWGRRRPWIFLGGVGSACSFIYLFNIPSSLSAITGVFIGLIAYSTFYTIFNVPYLSMPAQMSTDPNDRSALIAWRVRARLGSTNRDITCSRYGDLARRWIDWSRLYGLNSWYIGYDIHNNVCNWYWGS